MLFLPTSGITVAHWEGVHTQSEVFVVVVWVIGGIVVWVVGGRVVWVVGVWVVGDWVVWVVDDRSVTAVVGSV